MSGKILRELLIVALSLFIARFVWLGFTVRESGKVIGNTQVKIAMSDVKRMRQALDFLWDNYNLDEERGKTYATQDYTEFRNRLEKAAERRGGLPFDLPTGKNFADFSYMGHDQGYHIKVRAKDKTRTIVRGTLARMWRE